MTRIEFLTVGLIIGAVGLASGLAVMSARERARDVTRLAHVRELQIGLELYFNNNGTYPVMYDALALGQTVTACLSENGFGSPCTGGSVQVPYIEFVPSAPATGLTGDASCSGVRNAYCYTADGPSFRVQFELEKPNAILGLVKGANCATETGFEPGICSVYTAPQAE